MDYEQFITIVEQAIGDQPTSDGEASLATRATLQTLGERIDPGQARQLASQLPAEIAPWVATQTPAQRFDADEFVRRLGEREGVDPAIARRHAGAVLTALDRAIPSKEWSDVVAELPRSFATLLPSGPWVDVVDADKFLSEVAQRAGVDVATAERATNAVLETLAERIAGGEVEDLIVHLPMELHAPLERGRARSSGRATPMRLEKFIETVAQREGVSLIDAARHARAVTLALREAVGEREFLDIAAQLPDDYLRTLARARR